MTVILLLVNYIYFSVSYVYFVHMCLIMLLWKSKWRLYFMAWCSWHTFDLMCDFIKCNKTMTLDYVIARGL